MNIFKELVHSVYDCKSYVMFMKDRKRKTFLYAMILVVLYYVLSIGIPFMRFQLETGGILHIADEYLPDFKIENGKVKVFDVIEYEDGDVYVSVNTLPGNRIDAAEMMQKLHSYSQVIIMDSEQLVLRDGSRVETIYYRDLNPGLYVTKQLLLETVRPYVNTIMTVGLVLVFLFMTASFFLGVLTVALIGMVIASCMDHPMTFGEAYQMAVYTRTLPLVIKAFVLFLPIWIPMFFIINFGISAGLFCGAVRAVKMQGKSESPLEFYSEKSEYDWERRWKADE